MPKEMHGNTVNQYEYCLLPGSVMKKLYFDPKHMDNKNTRLFYARSITYAEWDAIDAVRDITQRENLLREKLQRAYCTHNEGRLISQYTFLRLHYDLPELNSLSGKSGLISDLVNDRNHEGAEKIRKKIGKSLCTDPLIIDRIARRNQLLIHDYSILKGAFPWDCLYKLLSDFCNKARDSETSAAHHQYGSKVYCFHEISAANPDDLYTLLNIIRNDLAAAEQAARDGDSELQEMALSLALTWLLLGALLRDHVAEILALASVPRIMPHESSSGQAFPSKISPADTGSAFRSARHDRTASPAEEETEKDTPDPLPLFDAIERIKEHHPGFLSMDKHKPARSLFPRGIVTGAGESRTAFLPDFLRRDWTSAGKQHALQIIGEGGLGKTVSILSLVSEQRTNAAAIPAVYIPMNQLAAGNEYQSIDGYLRTFYQNEYSDIISFANVAWDETGHCGLILILDGWNELPWRFRRIAAQDAGKWALFRGIELIVLSRQPVAGLTMPLVSFSIMPLAKDTVASFLRTQTAKKCIGKTSRFPDTPLTLQLYSRTEEIKKKDTAFADLLEWDGEGTAAKGLMHNYLQAELALCFEKFDTRFTFAEYAYAVTLLAPCLFCRMSANEEFFIPLSDFEARILDGMNTLSGTGMDSSPQLRKIVFVTGDLAFEERLRPPFAKEIVLRQYIILTHLTGMFMPDANGRLYALHQNYRDGLGAYFLCSMLASLTESDPKKKKKIPLIRHANSPALIQTLSELLTKEALSAIWSVVRGMKPTDTGLTEWLLTIIKVKKCFSVIDFRGMDIRHVVLASFRPEGQLSLALPAGNPVFDSARASLETFSAPGHGAPVNAAVCFSLRGSLCIASGGSDARVCLWDARTSKCLGTLSGHSGSISALAVFKDKDSVRLISGSRDGSVKVWDPDTSACLREFRHCAPVSALAVFYFNGKYMCVSADETGCIFLWNPENEKEAVAFPRKHSGGINVLKYFRRNGRPEIITGDSGCEVMVWDISAFPNVKVVKEWNVRSQTDPVAESQRYIRETADNALDMWHFHKIGITEILVDCDTDTVLITTSNGTIEQRTLNGSGTDLLAFYAPDNTSHDISSGINAAVKFPGKLFVGTDSGEIISFKLGKKSILFEKRFTAHSDYVTALTVSGRDDRQFLVSASCDKTVKLWDIGKDFAPSDTFTGHTDWITHLEKVDKKYLLTLSADCSLRLWDLELRYCRRHFPGHPDYIQTADCFDEATFATGSADGTLRLWNIRESRCIAAIPAHSGWVNTVRFFRRGARAFLISGGSDSVLQLWDCAAWQSDGRKLCGHTGWVLDVDIFDNGMRAVSAGYDGTLIVWDLIARTPVMTLTGHRAGVKAVKTYAGGARAVSISYDHTARIWDLRTGVCLAVTPHGAYHDWLTAADVYQTDNILHALIASADGTIRDWVLTEDRFTLSSTWTCPAPVRAVKMIDSHSFLCAYGDSVEIYALAAQEKLSGTSGIPSVSALTLDKKENKIIAVSFDGCIRIIDMADMRLSRTIPVLHGVVLVGISAHGLQIDRASDREILRENGMKI